MQVLMNNPTLLSIRLVLVKKEKKRQRDAQKKRLARAEAKAQRLQEQKLAELVAKNREARISKELSKTQPMLLIGDRIVRPIHLSR